MLVKKKVWYKHNCIVRIIYNMFYVMVRYKKIQAILDL